MPTYSNYSGEIASNLQNFRVKGQKEASKHRPPPDATSLDLHESGLKSEAEGWLNTEQRLFDTTVTEVSRSLMEARQKAIELRTSFDQLVRDDTATSAVEADLAGDRPVLVKTTEARLRAEADIRYYKAANNIHEEPRYPDSTLWHFGVLAILALLEVVVNAFFYENSQGLLGGVVVAMGIAALNMGAALGLGYWFCFKNLASIDKKVVGWACLVAFVFVAVFCNSLFASFRSEYQLVADPSEFVQVKEAFQRAWPEALLIFRGSPRFQDHWSFILFGVGIVLSVWAFYKGYTLDDKYPGYGLKDRNYKAAIAAEHEQQGKVRQKAKELLHHRKAAVQAALHEPTTQVGMLARRIADLTHARQSLESQAGGIQRDYALVIEAYRHANAAVRALPAPAYFAEAPVLSTRIDGSASERVVSELATVQEELKALGEKHREPLNGKLKALQEDTAEILSNTMAAYLKDVQKEAEDNISRTTHTINRVQAA
ncbi:hypothetical protein [Cupriavidus necator]|uniref:hypothetical protein n=1 Tax=Cupriavidus necator TaxID=106590 RepID=UPI0005B2F22B|nr:hypothetical protein [Cupriavidus necator]